MKVLFVFGCLAVICEGYSVKKSRKFPSNFVFGASTASYQIEGAWNEDGKGESIWDHLVHNNPSVVTDLTNGDIACDSYHNYKRDVEMMRELGLDVYRFSLSWPRILPTGFANEINPAGINYYNNLIDEMLKYNITPFVTLYHWDLPQKIQELGGFSNPLIAGWFEDYARVVFENFGDRVKYWMTFNEPKEICFGGYGSVTKAPYLNSTAVGTYLCAKNLVLAHANAYRAYHKDFKPTQRGQCGITISIDWYEPLTDSEEDKFAAEITRQAEWMIYAEPIFSTQGGFPKELTERVAEKSKLQGYPWSRLPEFTAYERCWVRGTADFFGLNHYVTVKVTPNKDKKCCPVPSLPDDEDAVFEVFGYKNKLQPNWLEIVRNGIYNVITGVQKRYGNPVLYITENGWPVNDNRPDELRIMYYRSVLEGVLDAIDAGVNLRGYMTWSLLDNFEWLDGYTERFGLYEVDFEDPARTRTPRKSAFVYKQIIRNRYIDHYYDPHNLTMTIDAGH